MSSSINDNVYINNLYGLSHIFNETSYLASQPGQYNLIVSDGTIPNTVAGNLYFIPHGQVPINISNGGTVQNAANVGVGTGEIFRDITSATVNLRTLVAGAGISISTVGDNVFIINTGAGGGTGYEDLATSSAIDPDPNIEITNFNLNTGTTATLTLADPSPATPGIKKKIITSQISAGSQLNLLIPSLINGTSLLFTVLGMSASLVYTSNGYAIDNSGAVLIP
jgi:hypothetical protein